MNEIQHVRIKKIVDQWIGNKEFMFQERKVTSIPNRYSDGEYLLVFHSLTDSFFYDDENRTMIPLRFDSDFFATTTLSDSADVSNLDQDVNRLVSFLEKFDINVKNDREQKFADHTGNIYTSNIELL